MPVLQIMTDTPRPDDPRSEHIASEQLAAFLDERLPGSEREDVVAHLASCSACRAELIELRETLASEGGRVRARVAGIGVVAALAATLVLAVVLQQRDQAGRLPSTTRAPATRPFDAPPIPIAEPPDGSMLSGRRPRLVWRAAGSDAMYLVTVQDTVGKVVWTSTVTDSAVTIPLSAGLMPGGRYFWSVDARLSDGQTAQTGVHSFIVR